MNSVVLPLVAERNVILESSEYYRANMRMLGDRQAAGLIPPDNARYLRQHITMAALRQAGVSLRRSERMMKAA